MPTYRNFASNISIIVISSIVTHKIWFKLFVFLSIQFSILVGEPLIQLPGGWIRGRKDITIHNTTFYAFEKIPYAAPPVGNLRFKPPQFPSSWEGILNTTELDVVCYQLARPGPESEDCLYLNVFTPWLLDGHTETLPVMFYIHGGGFYDGSARKIGSDLFVENGIVYVTINYRLGPFGFLSTGDDVIPGNYGLKDQLFALQWVHKNIKLFGGNPDRVTIVGHSAGAASVAFLQLNRKARGWFSGAIVQSGTALGVWAYQVEPRKNAFTFARLLNATIEMDYNETKSLLDYLQQVPAQDLKKASNQFYHEYLFGQTVEYVPNLQGAYFGVVLEPQSDEAFLTEKMYGLYKDGDFARVPLLIGFTSEECLEYYRDVNSSLKAMEVFDENLDWLVSNSMNISDKDKRTEMGRLIRDIYTNGEPFSKNLSHNIRFCSDFLLTVPMMKHAELCSKFTKTYFYVFSYDGKFGGIDVHFDDAGSVGHGEENKYLLCRGSKCDLSHYSKSDQITQKRLVKIWTDFAKYGNPTPQRSELLQNITWPQLSTVDGAFYYVDIGDNLKIKNYPTKTYGKWSKLYNTLGHDDFITY